MKGKFAIRPKVLDKGSVELLDFCGTDLTVVNSARVSFGKRKEVYEKSDELNQFKEIVVIVCGGVGFTLENLSDFNF